MEDGLLTQADLAGIQWNVTDDKADFGLLYRNRLNVLRKAYARFTPGKDYTCFVEENSNWLPDFTLFMALKDKFGGKPWYEWEHDLKFQNPVPSECQKRTERGNQLLQLCPVSVLPAVERPARLRKEEQHCHYR